MTRSNKEDLSPLQASGGDGEEAVSYLCLDAGLEPLRRDCVCRGTDAGFVHLSCLDGFATAKSKGWDGHDMNEFRKPWRDCPSCHKKYQNKFDVDIAIKCGSFVRRQYPHDTQMEVEALNLKLRAFDSMFYRLDSLRKREYGVTANVMLSMIDRMRTVAPLTIRYSLFEAEAYHTHGCIALNEGTDESARRAVAHFENQLEVFEAIGDAEDIAIAKRNNALAKSKYDDDNNEELLKASQELYEIRVAEFGEENEYTIISGKNYAIDLHKAKRRGEAMELLTKLLATSKQVLGPHHNITKEVKMALDKIIEVANHD